MEITKDMLIKDIIYENPDVLDKFMFIGYAYGYGRELFGAFAYYSDRKSVV